MKESQAKFNAHRGNFSLKPFLFQTEIIEEEYLFGCRGLHIDDKIMDGKFVTGFSEMNNLSALPFLAPSGAHILSIPSILLFDARVLLRGCVIFLRKIIVMHQCTNLYTAVHVYAQRRTILM